MTGGTIGGDVKEVEGENTKTGSGIGGVEGGVVVKGGGVTERRGVTGRGRVGTGGKGSVTQWVHAEYMEGSETIHLTFTQWVRGGYFSKVPTKVPTG